MKLTEQEKRKIKAFTKRLVENRKRRPLNESFKRDAIDLAEKIIKVVGKLEEANLDEDKLQSIADEAEKRTRMYDKVNQQWAVDTIIFNNVKYMDEDRLFNMIEDLAINISNRYG